MKFLSLFITSLVLATSASAQDVGEDSLRGLICEAREGDEFYYCQVPGAGSPPRQPGAACTCKVGFGQDERTIPGRVVWKSVRLDAIPKEAIPKGSGAYHDCMDAGGYHGDCAHHLK